MGYRPVTVLFPYIVALGRVRPAQTKLARLGGAHLALRACLAHHELHERVKAQGLSGEAFERQRFEHLVLMHDQQGTSGCRQV